MSNQKNDKSRTEGTDLVRWVEFVIAGKVLGIAAAIWVGGAAMSRILELPTLPSLAAAIAVVALAGFAEGSLVGLAQSRVLGGKVAGLRSGWWTITTGIATAAAWSIAMYANTLALDWDLAAETLIVLVVVLGSALGVLVGTVQWFHLRQRLPGAAGWITANAFAWVAGTLAAFGFLAFLGPESSPTEVVLVAVTAGIAVGATVGLITGAALIGLLHRPPPHSLTR